jgi:phenol 2-monooxygenase
MDIKIWKVERRGRDEAEIGRMSKFGQILLNQGSVEQNFIDHLCAKSKTRVEWNRRAQSLQITASDDDTEAFPIAVGVACLDEHSMYCTQITPGVLCRIKRN